MSRQGLQRQRQRRQHTAEAPSRRQPAAAIIGNLVKLSDDAEAFGRADQVGGCLSELKRCALHYCGRLAKLSRAGVATDSRGLHLERLGEQEQGLGVAGEVVKDCSYEKSRVGVFVHVLVRSVYRSFVAVINCGHVGRMCAWNLKLSYPRRADLGAACVVAARARHAGPGVACARRPH